MSITAESMTPADIRACTSNNDGNGMWGGDWLAYLLLFTLIGGGGFFAFKKIQGKKKEKEAAKPDPDADYVDDDEDYGYSEEYEDEDDVDFIAEDEDNDPV